MDSQFFQRSTSLLILSVARLMPLGVLFSPLSEHRDVSLIVAMAGGPPLSKRYSGCPILCAVSLREGWEALHSGFTMPRGLVRYQQASTFHFLTFSCYRRKGGWPRSQVSLYPVEGAPGPSRLGTGDDEVVCPPTSIHAGSCPPLCLAVHSDSISTVPRMPV